MFRDAKVGDKVWRPVKDKPEGEWGEIEAVGAGSKYPLTVHWGHRTIACYATDGRWNETDSWPSLFWGPVQLPTLPTRPKRMVKKVVEGWLNVYPDNRSPCFHTTKELADRNQLAYTKRIACVHITSEYEVEE